MITELLTTEQARAAAQSLDAGFTITCGNCRTASAALDWCETSGGHRLPIDRFQCPQCAGAFLRVPSRLSYGPAYLLQPVDAALL